MRRATIRDTKDKAEAFFIPRGQSYYWAEIMGLGLFDNQWSANSPGDKISNIMAGNLGVGFKATDKLKFTFDVWQAILAEEDRSETTSWGRKSISGLPTV